MFRFCTNVIYLLCYTRDMSLVILYFFAVDVEKRLPKGTRLGCIYIGKSTRGVKLCPMPK